VSAVIPACKNIRYVLDKLTWMRAERIWPNGLRYTWTDAFGVVLPASLYRRSQSKVTARTYLRNVGHVDVISVGYRQVDARNLNRAVNVADCLLLLIHHVYLPLRTELFEVRLKLSRVARHFKTR
jgi:hypothetical protein